MNGHIIRMMMNRWRPTSAPEVTPEVTEREQERRFHESALLWDDIYEDYKRRDKMTVRERFNFDRIFAKAAVGLPFRELTSDYD